MQEYGHGRDVQSVPDPRRFSAVAGSLPKQPLDDKLLHVGLEWLMNSAPLLSQVNRVLICCSIWPMLKILILQLLRDSDLSHP